LRPFRRTIIELFDAKKRYLIPQYQRQYGWGVDPQLQLLWHDIVHTADKLERGGGHQAPHFMGAIVIAQIKTFGRQVQAYEVIDGQQRLTTFQLLLVAIRQVAADHHPEYAEEADKYLMNVGVMETPAVEKYKLWPSLIDRAVFSRIVDPDSIGAPVEHIVEDEVGAVRPAIAAHAYFVERVTERVCPNGEFDQLRLEKLFEALKDGLAVVSIELEDEDDPQTIFETLNSRGLDLSAGDLMRNFIFQRGAGLGQDEQGSLLLDQLYRTYWLPLDRWFWRTGETRGRLTRPRLDWMLVDHLAMKTASLVSAETLYDTYRQWIIDEAPYPNVEEELRDIASSASVHRRVLEQEKSDPLGRFGRFARAFDVTTTMPLVLYLVNEAGLGERLGEALALLESYIVRRDICGLATNNYNRFFTEAVGKLRPARGDQLDELRALLASGTIDIARWPDDVEWRRQWLSRAQYKAARQPRLRYLLEGIEERKRTGQDEVVEIKSDLTVEHIMPQKWREHWEISGSPDIGPDDIDIELIQKESARDARIHLLGNLTLLTQALNARVSNGPFEEKMPALRAQSALMLNRDLYNYKQWDEAAITARGESLFAVARQVWQGPPPKAAREAALGPAEPELLDI
jgi:Protein of unknown function DUF262/Protein of unknown function (DUF1524)